LIQKKKNIDEHHQPLHQYASQPKEINQQPYQRSTINNEMKALVINSNSLAAPDSTRRQFELGKVQFHHRKYEALR
jgi:uncharacterized iron-regulated protein